MNVKKVRIKHMAGNLQVMSRMCFVYLIPWIHGVEGDVPASLCCAGVMSSFGYASEGDIFLLPSASLRKQKSDVQAKLAVEWWVLS